MTTTSTTISSTIDEGYPGARVVASAVAAPLDQRPAAVYLARLAVGARRSQLGALRTMAHLLAGMDADPFTLPWQQLGYQHTQALRTLLAERYAPATANRMLAALRGVLTECWRLGLMDAEARARASDVAAVRGATIPRGRALKGGELRALFAVCSDGSAAGARAHGGSWPSTWPTTTPLTALTRAR